MIKPVWCGHLARYAYLITEEIAVLNVKPDWLNENKQKDSMEINQKYSQLSKALVKFFTAI
jgi:hypothetical protein